MIEWPDFIYGLDNYSMGILRKESAKKDRVLGNCSWIGINNSMNSGCPLPGWAIRIYEKPSKRFHISFHNMRIELLCYSHVHNIGTELVIPISYLDNPDFMGVINTIITLEE